METAPFNLIIGCGGSGLKTMAALNRLLVQNPKMLPRMGSEIYYLAVDTDMSDMQKFKDDIKEQAGDYATPFVETIALSRDINILNDIVHPKLVVPFKSRQDDAGLARVREHWWFDGADPYIATKAKNLVQGASQCPTASYGLAWYRLQEEIGGAVQRIVKRMIARGTGDPAQLRNMNVIVVAGLSGGTGRGSWSLVTFKIRECLLEQCGTTVPPVGIFFDANVYDNIVERFPNQRLSIEVNSATGVSELSCWMKNGSKKGADVFAYHLPNWESPSRPGTDVLKVDLALNPTSGAPVDSAYLICGQSRSAVLKNHSDYHEMAGAAVYTMIAHPEILSRSNNDGDPFNSLGASTFEVDVPHIRAYFEKRACGIALARLSTCVEDVSPQVSRFFAVHPFAAVAKTAKDLKQDPAGSVYQRAVAALLGENARKASLANVRKQLKAWDYKKAWREIAKLLVPRPEEEIRKAVATALSGFGRQGPDKKPMGIGGDNGAEAVRAAMREVYKGGDAPSIGRALEFLKDVKAQIESAKAEAPKSIQMPAGGSNGEAKEPAAAVEETLRNYSPRSFKEMVKGIGSFNPTEIDNLVRPEGDRYVGIIPEGIALVNYPKIKAVFDETLSGVVAEIETLAKACTAFSDCCHTAKAAIARKESDAAGAEAGQDAFSKLFATPDEIDKTLCRKDDWTRFYRKTLVPIVESREKLEELVAPSIHVGTGMADFINGVVEDGTLERLADGKGRIRDLREGFIEELVKQTENNVRLEDDFMEKNFSFLEVLRRNREFWNDELEKAQGSGPRRIELDERFELTLGTRSVRSEANPNAAPVLPPVNQLQNTIAASLASRCAPWWIVGRTDEKQKTSGRSVTEFVPFALDKPKDRDAFETCMAENVPFRNVQAFGLSDAKGGSTPFFYVAFVSEGVRLDSAEQGMHPLDKVTSISRYYSRPDVTAMLLKAEDPEGNSIFSDGLGYISPIYVRDKKLSAYRWKPWTKDDSAAEAAAGNEATDLMLYALLGNGLNAEQGKFFAEKLDPYGWSLPAIRMAEKGKTFKFVRKALAWDGSANLAAPDPACEWNKGELLCTGIYNLDTMLRGKGRTGKDGKLKQADVEAGNKLKALLGSESALFEKHVRDQLGADSNKLWRTLLDWLAKQRDAARNDTDKGVLNRLVSRLDARLNGKKK